MNIYVKFVGDVSLLLKDLPEREYLEEYFLTVNRFELKNEDDKSFEIYALITESHHYFYVQESDFEVII